MSISPCGTLLAFSRNKYVVQVDKLISSSAEHREGFQQISKSTVYTSLFTEKITLLHFSPNGKVLLIGSDGGSICFYNTSDWTLCNGIERVFIKRDKCINCIAFHENIVVIGVASKIFVYL